MTPTDLTTYWQKYIAAFGEVIEGMDGTDKVTIRMTRDEITEFRANLMLLLNNT